MYYLITLGFGLISFGVLYLINKFIKKNSSMIWKFVSLFLFIIFFAWYLLAGRNILTDVYSLKRESSIAGSSPIPLFNSKFLTAFALLGSWLYIILHSITVLTPFFKFNVAKNVEKYISPVLALICFITIPNIVFTYTDKTNVTLIGIFISCELGLIIAKLVYGFIFIDHNFKINKQDLKELLFAIPILLIFAMPYYIPHGFLGRVQMPEASHSPLDFHTFHRVYIYITFIYMIGLTLIFRNRKGEYARMALMYITFAAMINYSLGFKFIDFIHPWSWPLHICNTAMYILPIAIATKNEKIFYFTFFINILGAFLAIFMPDYGVYHFLENRPVSFWLNHIEAATMPFALVLLNVFNRPSKKQFIYSMVGFTGYFIIVLCMNSLLTAYKPIYANKHNGASYHETDFFFINSDFIAKKVHAEFLLEDFKLEFDIGKMHFLLYPLYQALYYLGFILMSVGMWFVYTWIFKAQDALINVHTKYKKVKLDELLLCQKYQVKEVKDCMNENSVNKLMISHFSKKYGEKANFAVEDINFEAHSGEIVGFLGPNGAGKSTTIKAIVGIHLPTSGTIEINGYDIVNQPVEAKSQLGFVPDHYALYENLTGREYLNYIADLYDVSKADRDNFLNEYLETLSMEKAIDNKIQTYSHGMKQKIAIMASIIHNPKLWILDEPLTGLDPVSIYQVKKCLKQHAEKGNIVFFSSHLIDIVEKLCDRIIILSNHRIQDVANVHELLASGVDLEEYYMQISGQETGDK